MWPGLDSTWAPNHRKIPDSEEQGVILVITHSSMPNNTWNLSQVFGKWQHFRATTVLDKLKVPVLSLLTITSHCCQNGVNQQPFSIIWLALLPF